MNLAKKLATIGIILLTSTLLTGCNQTGAQEAWSQLQSQQEIQEGRSSETIKVAETKLPERTVNLEFEEKFEGENLTISIFLMNPRKETITSAQTWLTFNPDHLEGLELKIKDSDFTLTAPYQNGFDQEKGIVKIGRSTAGFTDKERIKVADVVLKLKNDARTIMISPFNYKNDPSSTVSANTVINDQPYNLLLEPPVPAVIIQNTRN